MAIIFDFLALMIERDHQNGQAIEQIEVPMAVAAAWKERIVIGGECLQYAFDKPVALGTFDLAQKLDGSFAGIAFVNGCREAAKAPIKGPNPASVIG